jgi:hypothetical protein
VLLRPRRHFAEALVRADYHARTIDILVNGSDAPLYLGILRESILETLETMPRLPYEEKVELRPNMRTQVVGRPRADSSVWNRLRTHSDGGAQRSAFHRRPGWHLQYAPHPCCYAGEARFAAGRCFLVLFEQGWRSYREPRQRPRPQAHLRLV